MQGKLEDGKKKGKRGGMKTKSYFEGCCLEGKRCKHEEESSREMFANSEAVLKH